MKIKGKVTEGKFNFIVVEFSLGFSLRLTGLTFWAAKSNRNKIDTVQMRRIGKRDQVRE